MKRFSLQPNSKDNQGGNNGPPSLSYHPSTLEELLLNTLFSPKKNALNFWPIDPGLINPTTIKLIPSFYKAKHGDLPAQVLPLFNGIYRRSLAFNQLLCAEAERVATLCHDNYIEPLFFKGLVSALKFYPELDMRPLDDIDLLVHYDDVSRAIAVLRENGWRHSGPVDLSKGCLRLSKPLNTTLDVHWLSSSTTLNEEKVWEGKRTMRIGKTEVFCPSDTDQLLHVCAPLFFSFSFPALILLDAMYILKTANIDWQALAENTRRVSIRAQLLKVLSYLKSEQSASVSQDFLDSLDKTAKTKNEKLYCSLLNFEPSFTRLPIFGKLERALRNSSLLQLSRLSPTANLTAWSRFFGFIRYLLTWLVQAARRDFFSRRIGKLVSHACYSRPLRALLRARLYRKLKRARSILFICKGNKYRSIFAEKWLARKLPSSGYSISSGAFGRGEGGETAPASAIEVAPSFGVDLSDHLSRPITQKELDLADIIFVLELAHRDFLADSYPPCRTKLFTFGLLKESGQINMGDHFGRSVPEVRVLYSEIDHCLQKLASHLAPQGSS